MADQTEDYPMYLMLKTSLSGEYIGETYKTFNPDQIKASNKTLNQYRVVFSCSPEEKITLISKLKMDKNILGIEYGDPDVSLEKSSSTSGKVTKTTPKSAKR